MSRGDRISLRVKSPTLNLDRWQRITIDVFYTSVRSVPMWTKVGIK